MQSVGGLLAIIVAARSNSTEAAISSKLQEFKKFLRALRNANEI